MNSLRNSALNLPVLLGLIYFLLSHCLLVEFTYKIFCILCHCMCMVHDKSIKYGDRYLFTFTYVQYKQKYTKICRQTLLLFFNLSENNKLKKAVLKYLYLFKFFHVFRETIVSNAWITLLYSFLKH